MPPRRARLRRVPGAGVRKKPTSASTRVLLFIDDSNLFIEGQRTAAGRNEHPKAKQQFRVDFGRLLEWIAEGRQLTDVYLVGSRSPEADTFWSALPKHGIRSHIFERQAGRAKGVDHDLVAEMVETAILQKREDAVIALVAGDGDYRSTLDRVAGKGWELEVYFWSCGCSSLIRNTPWYIDMDAHFAQFCYYERVR